MERMISVKETALRWELAPRTVTYLCSQGRIPGALKQGHSWWIPFGAQKPIDRRSSNAGKPAMQTDASLLPLPVGISDYRLASTEYYYVDKTMMIKDFLDSRQYVTLFTRPRRFGKTLNMDMLRTFFEKTAEDTSCYFVNRKIWNCGQKYRDYQGKYPVIFLTLKDAKYYNWAQTSEKLARIIADEFRRHSELLTSPCLDRAGLEFYEKAAYGKCSEVELQSTLSFLSSALAKHYGKNAVLIIDEYDTPIQCGYVNGFYNEAVSFMRNFLSDGLKDNQSLAFGFLTGILRVAKESIFSGLNNIVVNSVLDSRYSEYFGFTHDEVREIAEYYNSSGKMDEICEWYDGYRFGTCEIFNPWSVVNYFSNGCEARPFWLSTSGNEIIGEILKKAGNDVGDRLCSLVNGESITTYIDTSVIYPHLSEDSSAIYSFLLVSGYLKVIKTSVSLSGDYLCEVALPNKEISLVYRREILAKLRPLIPESTALSVEQALFTGDGEQLRQIIGDFLMNTVSSFDTAGENFYHGFILGICALFGNAYVTSNRESGDGRYDICMTPKKAALPGVIIELKCGKKLNDAELELLAEKALEQINAKKYDTELKEKGVNVIYRYGVAFSGKTVRIAM